MSCHPEHISIFSTVIELMGDIGGSQAEADRRDVALESHEPGDCHVCDPDFSPRGGGLGGGPCTSRSNPTSVEGVGHWGSAALLSLTHLAHRRQTI